MSKDVQIGQTDVKVSPVGLGTNAVGGQQYYPEITDDAGRAFLRTALNEGVNFWDTAYVYGPERSEEIIGEVLAKEQARQEIALATKIGPRFEGNDIVMDNHPAFLKQAAEDSMRRLQTDYLDMLYIHFPDKTTPKYEAIGALQELKEKGVIRSIGVSNFSLTELEEANMDGYVDIVQDKYNLLNREAENELFPFIREKALSFVPFFPFASGILAGKYDKDTTFAEGDTRLQKPEFQDKAWRDNLEKVAKLQEIASRKDKEVSQLVLAYYLNQEEIDVVIPGAKRPEQVTHNKQAEEVTLTADEIKEINLLFQ